MIPSPRPGSTRQARAAFEYAMGTAGLAMALALAACTARGRSFLVARWWCIVTPHRIRTGCAQAWIHSRYGKIPIVLLTRRRPFGECVYLWCRAGTSAADFRSARQALAAACWASDVQVRRHARHAHVIALDVIRREPTAQSSGHPWFDTGTPGGSPDVPAPREPGDDAYWTGGPPRDEPARWMNG